MGAQVETTSDPIKPRPSLPAADSSLSVSSSSPLPGASKPRTGSSAHLPPVRSTDCPLGPTITSTAECAHTTPSNALSVTLKTEQMASPVLPAHTSPAPTPAFSLRDQKAPSLTAGTPTSLLTPASTPAKVHLELPRPSSVLSSKGSHPEDSYFPSRPVNQNVSFSSTDLKVQEPSC